MFAFLVFSLFEFTCFSLLSDQFGFAQTFLAYLAPSFFGAFILGLVGRSSLSRVQKEILRGGRPGRALLKTFSVFLSGILFLLPTLTTRVLSVLLWIPGVQILLMGLIVKKLNSSSAVTFRTWRYDFQQDEGDTWDGLPTSSNPREPRDVSPQILDIPHVKASEQSR